MKAGASERRAGHASLRKRVSRRLGLREAPIQITNVLESLGHERPRDVARRSAVGREDDDPGVEWDSGCLSV